jgi:hypothetical protein
MAYVELSPTVYAAPFDAMAYNGMQVNGAMEVSQENGYDSFVTVNGKHVCDGWFIGYGGLFASGASCRSEVLAPGFAHCLFLAVGAPAQASLAAGDVYYLQQFIEGYRIQRLAWGGANASPITIGFWSANTPAGLYSVSVRNVSAARSYVGTYAQAVAGVAQYNVITVPGDTTGTWPIINGPSLNLGFTLAAGSTYTAASANTWLAGNFIAAPGQVNGANSTSNSLKITGVVVLPGVEAPSAARSPLIMRPYDQELLTCRRYWRDFKSLVATGNNLATGGFFTAWTLDQPMRATPSLAGVNISYTNCSALAVNGVTSTSFSVRGTVTASGYAFLTFDATLDARL